MMKMKTKITLITNTLAILSLTKIGYQWQPQAPPQQPDIRLMWALTESGRDNTLPTENKAVVTEQTPQISTRNEDFSEPTVTETAPTQPTEKEEPTNTPTHTKQTATKLSKSKTEPRRK